MINNLILLQDAGASGSNTGGGLGSLIMIVALIAIFYFFMIRPQSKKQKEIKKFRENLSKGDKVITAGGVYGIIKEVKDTSFVIEITSNVCIRVDKNSVYPSAQDATQSAGK